MKPQFPQIADVGIRSADEPPAAVGAAEGSDPYNPVYYLLFESVFQLLVQLARGYSVCEGLHTPIPALVSCVCCAYRRHTGPLQKRPGASIHVHQSNLVLLLLQSWEEEMMDEMVDREGVAFGGDWG